LTQLRTTSWMGRSNPEGLGVSRRFFRKERETSCESAPDGITSGFLQRQGHAGERGKQPTLHPTAQASPRKEPRSEPPRKRKEEREWEVRGVRLECGRACAGPPLAA